jgi:hypothetical protein
MPHTSYQNRLNQLIHMKLYRPQVSSDLIDRPHLLSRLDDGLNHNWISLDEGDNHPYGPNIGTCGFIAGCEHTLDLSSTPFSPIIKADGWGD